MPNFPRKIELLAPARNLETGIAAIDHGADAVYIGARHHGARAAAGNSVEDIRRLTEYAHSYGVRIYVTLNTLVYDDEIDEVQGLVGELYRAGVDALIVQDMSILKMSLPPIALHASTQCDIRTPEKARFLEEAGFSQLVLARELTLKEIEAVRAATTVPLEAFVHGALCVSYSGNCQASYALTGRSANRGECAQICRLAYDLIDGDGNKVLAGKHLLSLRDMNRLASLGAMIDAGISSFKIEGRLKDLTYVKTVTVAYRRALDSIIDASDGRLVRSSLGRSETTFEPDPSSVFNRGFTDYFLYERRPVERMASMESPKCVGEPIGTVVKARGNVIEASLDKVINNGDGLSYYDPEGRLSGFRVNRVEGRRLYVATATAITPGTRLYRNMDIKLEAMMSRPTAERRIDVRLQLRTVGRSGIALDIATEEDGMMQATALAECELVPASRPQGETRRVALGKLGDTVYRAVEIIDRVGEIFVPLSVVTALRRKAVEALDRSRRAAYPWEFRKAQVPGLRTWKTVLEYGDNVANRLSREFFAGVGASDVSPALEAQKERPAGPLRVMQTRYCLRRELGACLRTPAGGRLKGPLTLRGLNFDLMAEFDCAKCEMAIRLR